MTDVPFSRHTADGTLQYVAIEDLDRESLPLVLMCKRIADNPDEHSRPVADKARKLYNGWLRLQKPYANLRETRKAEAQLARLYKRMAAFLAKSL